MKVVINRCFGGFGLSPLAIQEYLKLQGKECFFYNYSDKEIPMEEASTYSVCYTQRGQRNEDHFYAGSIERDDPILIQVIESLGEEASSGDLAELKIVEIPDGIQWEIDDYDGRESIEETHRSWG
jgi:hypothetical protein